MNVMGQLNITDNRLHWLTDNTVEFYLAAQIVHIFKFISMKCDMNVEINATNIFSGETATITAKMRVFSIRSIIKIREPPNSIVQITKFYEVKHCS